ncbi:MAG: L,D-transpeptidase family protein [bacterium]
MKINANKILLSLFVLLSFVICPFLKAEAKEVKVRKILVEKSKRTLSLMDGKKVVKKYSVSLGRQPVGAKSEEGDGKTPEGTYVIDWRNPDSKFYKSLHISYPNLREIARAKKDGVSPGGMIMIHGLPNGLGVLGKTQLLVDWTDGCIAVTDEEMDEIWGLVEDGTEIEIQP